MGLASALNAPPAMSLQWAPLSGSGERLLFSRRPAHLTPPLRLRSRSRSASLLTFARRRNHNATVTNNTNKLQKLGKNGGVEEEDEEGIDDDAFDALFAQLEEDLKKDDPSLFDGDQEITEEDLAKLDEELAAIDKEIAEVFDMVGYEREDGDDDEDEDEDEILVEVDEDENEEEEPLQLRNWQLRRLALALKTGRRKTNIKSLAAELCIDRAVVLELLRNPPPSLLMLSAALPDDEPSSPIITITDTKTIDTVAETAPKPKPKPEPSSPEGKVPVHVMQQKFASQKRLKKSHAQTLEDVYRRTKRPTNAMIQSIVDVTNLPRKRVVKWFEDKRAEEGVPEQRRPYQRSVPDTA